MRFVLTLLGGLLLGSAHAEPSAPEHIPDCPELAQRFSKNYIAFPDTRKAKIETLSSWKASCARAAPKGQGNVLTMCQARLPEGDYVFYWLKQSVNGESSGYELCEF